MWRGDGFMYENIAFWTMLICFILLTAVFFYELRIRMAGSHGGNAQLVLSDRADLLPFHQCGRICDWKTGKGQPAGERRRVCQISHEGRSAGRGRKKRTAQCRILREDLPGRAQKKAVPVKDSGLNPDRQRGGCGQGRKNDFFPPSRSRLLAVRFYFIVISSYSLVPSPSFSAWSRQTIQFVSGPTLWK